MKKMKNLLIFIQFFLLIFSERQIKYTTKDPELINKYQITHLEEGSKKMYPRFGDLVGFHFKAMHPTTYKLYFNTRFKNAPHKLVLGSSNSTICWDNVISKMSKKEKLYLICEPEEVYGGRGNGIIPANEKIGFEIELLTIKRAKINQNIINNSTKSDL
jgi:hypothetical protein